MKPSNSVYVGGPPLDPPDDEPEPCPTCKGRKFIDYEKIDFKTLATRRWRESCPDCQPIEDD